MISILAHGLSPVTDGLLLLYRIRIMKITACQVSLALLLAATPCMAASGLSIEAGAAQAGGSYEFTLGSEELGD